VKGVHKKSRFCPAARNFVTASWALGCLPFDYFHSQTFDTLFARNVLLAARSEEMIWARLQADWERDSAHRILEELDPSS